MMSWTGKRPRLLVLVVAAFGCRAIPSGFAHAQTMRRDTHVIRTQFVKSADSVVDPSTLTGKLIMGYQGWFNCPGDGTTVGWWHWFTGVDPTVDNLPNAADYPVAEQCVTTMLDAGGNPVNLFSDANPATVETQFAWMQQYGLDGVALFVTLDADGCTLPSDWYLSLAGAATSAVHSGMQPSPNLPLPLP